MENAPVITLALAPRVPSAMEAAQPQLQPLQPGSERKTSQMHNLALKLGYVCVMQQPLLVELGTLIAAKMHQRLGDDTFQMAAYPLQRMPIETLSEFLQEDCVVLKGSSTTTWRLKTVSTISSQLGPVMTLANKSGCVCSGTLKAFRSKTQRVIRVVAKLLSDVEISYVKLVGRSSQLYVNVPYLLSTDEGEFYWPKDSQRREISYSEEETKELREEILSDLRALADAGHPLSPDFWRQLGEEAKAKEVEHQLAHPRARQSRGRGLALGRKRRRFSKEEFVIEKILSEKKVSSKAKRLYLVRWAGYDASWEVFRINGQPGQPIETWEPLILVANTEALQDWKHQQHLLLQ